MINTLIALLLSLALSPILEGRVKYLQVENGRLSCPPTCQDIYWKDDYRYCETQSFLQKIVSYKFPVSSISGIVLTFSNEESKQNNLHSIGSDVEVSSFFHIDFFSVF